MPKTEAIILIEKQIEEKTKAIAKLKKDIPKVIVLVVVIMFILP